MFLQPVPALLSLQTTLPVAVDSDVHLTWENPDEVDKYISHLQQIVDQLTGITAIYVTATPISWSRWLV